MFVNGRWQWVANTQDVINAQNELYDAQNAQSKANTTLSQTEELNKLSAAEDSLSLAIKKIEDGSVDDIDDMLRGIGVKELPFLQNIIGDAGRAIQIFKEGLLGYSKHLDYSTEMQNSAYTSKGKEHLNDTRNLKSSSEDLGYEALDVNSSHFDPVADAYRANDYMDDINIAIANGDLEGAKEQNRYRNDKIDYLGIEDESKLSDKDIEDMYNAAKKNAIGTNYTSGGLNAIGENGFEAYIDSNGLLIPINRPVVGNISSGGIIFNTEQMQNLRTLWDMSNLNMSADKSFVKGQSQPVDQSQDNRIIINGMTVDSGSSDGQALINALRRYVGNH